MMSPNHPITEPLDWEALTSDSLDLTPNQIEQAARTSRAIANPNQQWQVYINTLAQMGLEQWLTERAPELTVRPINDTNSLVQVGDIRVGVVAIASLPDAVVSLPKALIDLPEISAQFYLLVNVLEEQEQVRIVSYLRHDQIIERSQTQPLTLTADSTYCLPQNWFIANPDQFLLELRYLCQVSGVRCQGTGIGDQELAIRDQGSGILLQRRSANGDQELTTSPPPHLPLSPSPLSPPSLTERAINVGLWLRDQLDELAQEMSWVLMPALTPATSAMRSVVEEFQAVTHRLEAAGLAIAPEARGAYRDLRWGNVALRLYVMTWALPFDPKTPDHPPEWTLLLIVGAQPDAALPPGVGLRVQDQTQVLVERVFGETSQEAYLYARVVGTWDEQFWVTINLTNGVVITLPPFSFDPDRAD
jgi:hypothetical protein